MDGSGPDALTPQTLYRSIGSEAAPIVVDVRRAPAFEKLPRLLLGALRRNPETEKDWARNLRQSRPVVVYCVHGHEVSQNAAAELRAEGIDALYLEGGITAWLEGGFPTRQYRNQVSPKWVTRERPKIDRIACPWLIRRFIDPDATFVYVPSRDVTSTAERIGGTPYDIPDVAFSHVGDRCSFDAFLRLYDIADPALEQLALIVRGADTSRLDMTPQSAGLFAISLGLSAIHADDHVMLEHGMHVYDALYAWCRACQAETHRWPPAMA